MSKRKNVANPPPWGPHCFLRQGRHTLPFNKQRHGGHARRAERMLKLRQRMALLQNRTYDDGWVPLGGRDG